MLGMGGETGSNFGHLTSDIEKSRFLTSFEMTQFVWLGQRGQPLHPLTKSELILSELRTPSGDFNFAKAKVCLNI